MSLIGKLLGKLMSRGRLTLVQPNGARETYGPGGGQELTVRLMDRKVAFDIARNPRLGFGEAYMDGRIVIEDGTILELLEMIVGANRWELVRTMAGWKIRRRTLRPLDGTEPARELLRNALKSYETVG